MLSPEDTRKRKGDRHRKINGKRANASSVSNGRGGFQQKITVATKRLEELKKEVEDLVCLKSSLQASVAALKLEVAPLRAELGGLQTTHSKLQHLHAQLLKRVTELQNKEQKK